jgi:hypothetical protein
MTSFSLFVYHLPLVFIIALFFVKKVDVGPYLHTYFMGPDDVYFNYAIVLTIVLFVILIVPSVYKPIARSGFQYPIYVVLWFSTFWLVVYGIVKQSKGTYEHNGYKILVHLCYSIYNSSFALFVVSLFSKNYVPKAIAFSITCVGQLTFGLMLTYYSTTTRRIAAEYVAYAIFALLLTLYYCYDLEIMMFHRVNVYKKSDWFLGFIHIQTDITFRFWRDLIRYYFMNNSENPIKEKVDENEAIEPVISNRE